MLEISLNGEPRSIPAETTIADLLLILELTGQRLAVELNQEIVPRSEHETRKLNAGDRIEIVRAIGGG